MSGNPNSIATVVSNDSVPYEKCFLPYKRIQVALYHYFLCNYLPCLKHVNPKIKPAHV